MNQVKAHTLIKFVLRYARANGLEDKLSCRKFLEAAMKTEDKNLFHSTFNYFALKSARLNSGKQIGEGKVLTQLIYLRI